MDDSTIYDSESLARSLRFYSDATDVTVLGCGLDSLDALSGFKQLEILRLGGIYYTKNNAKFRDTLKDFSALPSFTKLKALTVQDCSAFDDRALDYVTQIPNLRAFLFGSVILNVRESFKRLERCPKLAILSIERYPNLAQQVLPNNMMTRIGGESLEKRRLIRYNFESYIKNAKRHKIF